MIGDGEQAVSRSAGVEPAGARVPTPLSAVLYSTLRLLRSTSHLQSCYLDRFGINTFLTYIWPSLTRETCP